MRIKYDKLTDTLYLEFKDTTVTTKRLSDDIAIDYDADGKMAGIELLGAKDKVAEDWKSFAVEYQADSLMATA
jgi:uncharacterized protein YuzE